METIILSTDSQDRWRKILQHEKFRRITEKLAIVEKDRVFCRHGLPHLLDTARIMYILDLEEDLCISADLIYAAGLLHDIGRLRQYEDGTPHDAAALPIAGEIMTDCGYDQDERDLILFAIASHRSRTPNPSGLKQLLANLLYQADKKSRLCFQCRAREDCYWPEELKNQEVFR